MVEMEVLLDWQDKQGPDEMVVRSLVVSRVRVLLDELVVMAVLFIQVVSLVQVSVLEVSVRATLQAISQVMDDMVQLVLQEEVVEMEELVDQVEVEMEEMLRMLHKVEPAETEVLSMLVD